MTLSTSFSLEEMEYLKGLHEQESLSPDDYYALRMAGWTRAVFPPVWHTGGEICAERGCDVWSHEHNAVLFLRHGEVVAKVSLGTKPSVVRDWLDSIHAHELATAP